MMRGFMFVVLLAGFATSAAAQAPDPTRPAGVVMMRDGAGSIAPPPESGVQTVILRPGGKSAAVINGQHVMVGDKLGDKRVARISESEVVLTGGSGREVIKVTPAIEKQPVQKKAASKRRETGTTDR